MRAFWLSAACVASALGAGACSDDSERKVTVVAASSLQGTLDDIAADWTSESGIEVEISYAGSQTLAAQLRDGFPADVAIIASVRIIGELSSTRALYGEPVDFALNEIVLAFASGVQPVAIEELIGSDLIITLADPAVPLGEYTAAAFLHVGIDPGIVGPASLEPSAAAVVTRLRTGDADVAVIYATDASGFANSPLDGALATYSAAAIGGATDHGIEFLDHLGSPASRSTLVAAGFLVP